METDTYFPGTFVSVYDPQTDEYKDAKVLRWYGCKSQRHGNYPSLIDVLFLQERRVSKAHFTWGVKILA